MVYGTEKKFVPFSLTSKWLCDNLNAEMHSGAKMEEV